MKYKTEKLFKNMKKGKDIGSSWVAKITGRELSEKFYPRLTREFLREVGLEWLGKRSENWPRGMAQWELSDGVYEVCAFASQKHAETFSTDDGDPGAERFFCRVSGGRMEKITREAVEELFPLTDEHPEEELP